MAVNTYYFDGSQVLQDFDWDNASNGVDGDPNTFTEADTDWIADLVTKGSTAPTSGGGILSVRVRAKHRDNGNQNSELTIRSDDMSVFKFQVISGDDDFTDWIDVDPPSGGWTWQELRDLRMQYTQPDSQFAPPRRARLYIVELEVTSIDKLETLQDDFSGSSLDTDKWVSATYGDNNATVIVDDGLELNITGNWSGVYVDTADFYDLSDSYVMHPIEMDTHGVNYWYTLIVYKNYNVNQLSAFASTTSSGDISWSFGYRLSGDFVGVSSITLSRDNSAWVRIRESEGVTYYDTSSNGHSWVNRASVATPFDVTATITELDVYSDTAKTTKIDNFNIEPKGNPGAFFQFF